MSSPYPYQGFLVCVSCWFQRPSRQMGISNAHLTVCIIHSWVTQCPICASPQSIRAGIAPSYRAGLTVQPHTSHSQASGSHACPASRLSSLHTCDYYNQNKLVLSSSLEHCFICLAFFLLWVISGLDPGSAWCGASGWCWRTKLVSVPEELCVEIGDCCFFGNASSILIPGCPFLSPLKHSLGIALHSCFTCCPTQWCLEPNHGFCCSCKINNTYILLIQALVFEYLWQISYAALVLICQHIKINKTLEVE